MPAPKPQRFDLFLTCPPGLEPVLLDEVKAHGWTAAKAAPGGVEITGAWHDVWRANLLLRGANRVLVRLGNFRAPSLNVLHGRTTELPLGEILGPGDPFHVEAVCRKSKIYHSGAAEERVAKAVMSATGAEHSEEGLKLLVRIENDHATISADSSGDLLHKRGFKQAVAKAPLRESMAALFLRACGYSGSEPVFDPMCGSGTVVIEAAEIARGLAPGRERSFAFERFPSFRADAYARGRAKACQSRGTELRFHGSDRAGGAIEASRANAERAGVGDLITFAQHPVSEVQRPEGSPGLVFVNPPYGERVSDRAQLPALYEALGSVLRDRFSGWRVGLLTSDERLAKATRLFFAPPGPPVPHGPIKIRLWQAGPL